MKTHRTIWGALLLTGNWRAELRERDLLFGSMGSIVLFLMAIVMTPALMITDLPGVPDFIWLSIMFLYVLMLLLQALLFVLMNKLFADQFNYPVFLWLNPLCPSGQIVTVIALAGEHVQLAVFGVLVVYGLSVVYFILLLLFRGELYGMRSWYTFACGIAVANPVIVFGVLLCITLLGVEPFETTNRGDSTLSSVLFLMLVAVLGLLYLLPQAVIFYRAAAKAALDAARGELGGEAS